MGGSKMAILGRTYFMDGPKIVFLIIFLHLDYRGLSVKKGIFLLFWHFLQNSSRDLPNFLYDCRGKWGVPFELHFLFEKNILDYRGLSVLFLRFLAFSPKQL